MVTCIWAQSTSVLKRRGWTFSQRLLLQEKDELEIRRKKSQPKKLRLVFTVLLPMRGGPSMRNLSMQLPSPMLHLQLPITLLKLTTSPKKRMVVMQLTVHHTNHPPKVTSTFQWQMVVLVLSLTPWEKQLVRQRKRVTG